MKYVALVVAVSLVGCGGDVGGDDGRAIDDFVPPEVVATYPDLLDVQVTCVRSHYVKLHRVLDCTGDPSQANAVQRQLDGADIAGEWCRAAPGYEPTGADIAQQAASEACFDTWVYGSCGELLAGPCRIAETWSLSQP